MAIESHYHSLLSREHEQVLRFYPYLTAQEQQALIQQIQHIDFSLLEKQHSLIKNPPPLQSTIEPFTDFSFIGQHDDLSKGKQLLHEGKMGCLVLAGGQGTRLRFDGPKGRFPVSLIKHKSLFQLLAEKTLAASKQASIPLSLAIMTSPENDEITKRFFADHHYWGLNPEQVSFFCQGTLPLLDGQGQLFLESRYHIAEGPNGNGQCLHDFYKSGIWKKWSEQGIQYLNVILIDNPLADPFDAELLGFHARQDAEITIKCTEKLKPQEKVGVIVKENGRVGVIEYSELSELSKTATRADGRLHYCCANLSLFCFSMNFIKSTVTKSASLPLHKAWKAAKFVNEAGITHLSATPIAWKFETFIFDWLGYADRIFALLYPREQCFAPLKNYTGEDSLETVQQAIQKRERQLLQDMTELESPTLPFELAAEFYYPTPELKAKWHKKVPKTSYVEP